MDKAELQCKKEEIENLKVDEQARITSKMSLNESKDSENNCNLNTEQIEEENIQNSEEDEDDDFGDFEEAPQTSFNNRIEGKELDTFQDSSNAENCQKSYQSPITSTSTTNQSSNISLTIADLLEQPQIFKTLKFNKKENSIFDDLFEQMDNIEGINLLEKKKEENEAEEEDDKERKLRHSFTFRSLNFWNQICFIEEAEALKFKFIDSITLQKMVDNLRLNFTKDD